jgi:hypothetical protein
MKNRLRNALGKITSKVKSNQDTDSSQSYSRNTSLRDFLYLDSERVRSFAAQLLRGIPENLVTGTGNEFLAKSGFEGNAMGMLKGKIEGDYRFFRTQNETRSFHHYLYSLFEEQLEKEKMITGIDESFDFSRWIPSNFHDGQFVKIQGVLRITDYNEIGNIMDMLPRIMETGMHLTKFGSKDGQTNDQIKQNNREQEKTLRDLRSMQLNKLTDLIHSFYGDGVRIKVVPNKNYPRNLFAGTGTRANFYDSSSGLNQKYGYEVDANWVTLGQINISETSNEPVPLSTGNDIEDGIEQLVLAMNQMTRIINSTRFPAITITPISIYRMVGKQA